jgi:N-terminal domain of (some) glycogen debranching enzymes
MPFKVQIGPPQISIHQGQTVLISDPDGQINWPSERGLYFLDTRVVSSWTVYANGEPWELLNGGEVALEPGVAWHTCILYTLTDGDKHSAPPRNCIEYHPKSRHAETLADWLQTVAKIQTRMKSSIAFFAAHLRTWPRSVYRSRAQIIPSSYLPRVFPGSSRHSDATA